MSDMQSSLPDFEATQLSSFVKLERVKLSDLRWSQVTLNMAIVRGGNNMPISAQLFEIDDERVRGLPPMRTWYGRHDQDIHMLFLVTPTLPVRQRPFGNGKTYLAIVLVEPEDTIEYELGLPIGIDLIHATEGTFYAFIFGEKDYNNVVLPTDDDDKKARASRLELLDIADAHFDIYRD